MNTHNFKLLYRANTSPSNVAVEYTKNASVGSINPNIAPLKIVIIL